MTGKNIYKELGGIDPQLILKAAPSGENKQVEKHKAPLVKRCAVAACFVLVLSICILSMFDFSDRSGYHSMLAITVYAADGTENSMILNQSCLNLNSSSSDENIFGKDVPTFQFYVAPVEHGEKYGVFDQYDIEISYNGKVVEGKDEHIVLAFAVPAHGVEGVGRYCIIGWFEETTDVFVTLKERESGEIVEKMTVNISYSKADAAYKMILTDLYSTADK